MDKRNIVSELFARTGVKLDEDDPALLLVEINQIMLDQREGNIAKPLDEIARKFHETATAQADDFVRLANETLKKFGIKTNEIKALLASAPGAPPAAATSGNRIWYVVVFLAGLATGLALAAGVTFISPLLRMSGG